MNSDHTHNGIAHHAFSGIEKEFTPKGLFALAHWFDESNQPYQAMAIYKKAVEADPDMGEAYYNMGLLYSQMNDQAMAVKCFKEAVARRPDMAEGYSVLGMFYYGEERLDEALIMLDQAVTINPKFAEAHFNRGLVLKQMGKHQASVASFKNALAYNPRLAPARWLQLLSLPMMYDTQDQIRLTRHKFTQNLDELIRNTQLNTRNLRQHALQGISTATNFYLQYQGCNDLILQSKYGELVHQVMTACYPDLHLPSSPQKEQAGKKKRIGYVSAYMCRHTVGSFLAGWIENHDHEQFQIYGYHLGSKTDALTAHLEANCFKFHHVPGNIDTVAAQILSDRLDILVYFEVGMHVGTLQLAALKLAPVQCAGWGHPVTTGLPTMDFFLTSELMEPEDAQAHYSESLICLPNLSLCYHPPKLPEQPLSKKDLGIPSDRFIFLSSQSIFKYLPQHDEIYPMIAQKAPHACFVFIRHQSLQATQIFQKRLRKAFKNYQLDADDYCFFSNRLNADGFLSLNMAADVLLDTFEWSGGKTTIEAISCGLPVVTCPGQFMRGRHAHAMLTLMEMDTTIASNQLEYCLIAARLANDSKYYTNIKQMVIARRHKLYDDRAAITALENFYASQVEQNRMNSYPTALTATHPHRSDACHKRGIAHLSAGEYDGAITAFKRAAQLDAHNPRHPFREAEAHLMQNRPNDAVAAYKQALTLRPEWEAAHYNLALALRMSERIDEAIEHAKAAIQINPNYAKAYPLLFRLAQHACDWSLADSISQRIDTITSRELSQGMKTTEPPMTHLRRQGNVAQNIQVAESWSKALVQATPQRPNLAQAANGSHRIRVGYLSSDFKDHAVAYQILGTLQRHDRTNFEIYGYACNPDDGSPYRKKLAQACDHFRAVHACANHEVARQIREDQIDILVEMSGHSRANRFGIAALRPAPVQVNYLGFLSSTGAPFIDYVIADTVVLPEENAGGYSEKVAYLPHCYQANDDRMPIAAKRYDRNHWGLPGHAFVFCSFNQPYKIDAEVFNAWMGILKQVENSVLWLVERAAVARNNLREAATNAGVDPDRLIFAQFVPLGENLARLQQHVDLVLDTMIYNGGATTSNALWAGVPVLTTLGIHWVSRMTASALNAIRLQELISRDLADYSQKAVDLARNPDKLAAIRERLWLGRTAAPLFNTSLFTHHLESAFKQMWQRHLKGLPPVSFKVQGEGGRPGDPIAN